MIRNLIRNNGLRVALPLFAAFLFFIASLIGYISKSSYPRVIVFCIGLLFMAIVIESLVNGYVTLKFEIINKDASAKEFYGFIILHSLFALVCFTLTVVWV